MTVLSYPLALARGIFDIKKLPSLDGSFLTYLFLICRLSVSANGAVIYLFLIEVSL